MTNQEVIQNGVCRSNDEKHVGRYVHEVLRLEVSMKAQSVPAAVDFRLLFDHDIPAVAWDTDGQPAKVDRSAVSDLWFCNL